MDTLLKNNEPIMLHHILLLICLLCTNVQYQISMRMALIECHSYGLNVVLSDLNLLSTTFGTSWLAILVADGGTIMRSVPLGLVAAHLKPSLELV